MSDKAFWDQIAPKYARDPIKDMEAYKHTLARTLSYLGERDSVLELGCGTGATALQIAPHVAQIVGTDLSSGMIAQAELRKAEAGAENAQFEAASVLEALSGRYDAVLGFNLFHLVPEAEQTFTQVHGALKEGGLFISKTPCLGDLGLLKRALFQGMIPLMRLLGKAPSTVTFYRRADLERQVEAAGFEIIELLDAPDISRYLVARKV